MEDSYLNWETTSQIDFSEKQHVSQKIYTYATSHDCAFFVHKVVVYFDRELKMALAVSIAGVGKNPTNFN